MIEYNKIIFFYENLVIMWNILIYLYIYKYIMSSITGSTGATGYTGATGFTGATGSQGPGLFTLKSFDNNIYFTNNNNATKITSTSSFSFFSSVEVYQYCVLSFTINKIGNSVTNYPKFMSLSTLSDINNCIFANNNPTVINTGLLAIFTNGIYFTQFYFNIYNNSIFFAKMQ